MVYYIVPPIIIVLGLSFLVFFVFRKKEAIEKEIRRSEEQEGEGNGKVIISKIHFFSLAFLEKMMLRIKLVFLKSYNQFDQWIHSVRNKKEEKKEEIETIEEAREEAEVRSREKDELVFFERRPMEAREEKAERKIPSVRPLIPEIRRTAPVMEVKEPGPAPMVSQKVVKPEKKKKEKSRLEEALIERIALNPRDIEAYERLGEFYLEQKNFEDALECFRQIMKLSPSHHRAKTKLKKLEKTVLGW